MENVRFIRKQETPGYTKYAFFKAINNYINKKNQKGETKILTISSVSKELWALSCQVLGGMAYTRVGRKRWSLIA